MTASRSTLANAFSSFREAFARWSPHRWEQRLSGLEQRLDEVNAKLSGVSSLAHLKTLAQRLDEVNAILFGVSSPADVCTNLTHLNALAQRLDADVVVLAERMDTNVRQIAQQIQDLVGQGREQLTTLASLSIDLAEQFAAARRLSQGNGPMDRQFQASASQSSSSGAQPLMSLGGSSTSATIADILVGQGLDPKQAYTFPNRLLPTHASELPSLLGLMRATRPLLRAGKPVVWAQPIDGDPLLSVDETVQVIGLLGPVRCVHDIVDSEKRFRVAVATARIEAATAVVRWSPSALHALHETHGSIMREAAKRLHFENVLYAIDLPGPEVDYEFWSQRVCSFCRIVAGHEEAVAGIVLPTAFLDMSDLVKRALDRVRSELQTAGVQDGVRFQWVRGPVALTSTAGIREFAQAHGIRFDFTPVNRGAIESQLEAYEDDIPYESLSFDLRLPSVSRNQNSPIELARWPGRSLSLSHHVGALKNETFTFEAEFQRSCARLAPVLDRRGQKQFETQVNLDATLMAYWPSYFVYNWPPPPDARTRLVEFDASEFLPSSSSMLPSLQGLLDQRVNPHSDQQGDPNRKSGREFLKILEDVARTNRGWESSSRQLQVDAHGYLKDRDDVTADAEHLITWMPANLGMTLELGSGYGVMARRVRNRAHVYICFDLTVEQATVANGLGALGLVADIHQIPFASGVFDTIIADNVIEHAVDPLLALREIARVLKSGGQGFLAIPHDFIDPSFRNTAHFWKADESSVRHALELAGLIVVRNTKVQLPELGVSGAYPSSHGVTGLWQVERP